MRLPLRVVVGVTAVSVLALSGCGKNESSQLSRAKAEVAKSEISAARIELKNAIQTHPKSGEARYLFGDLLLREDDPAAAAIELQRALEFGYSETLVLPRLAEALVRSGQVGRVEAYADTSLGDPAAQARLLAAVAQGVAAQGDRQRAESLVAKALQSDPSSSPAQLMKARLAAAGHDPAAAMAAVDSLLAAHPDNAEGWSLKGDLLLRQPDGLKPAMDAFTQSLKARPKQEYAHNALIALHLAQGDLDGAKKQFDQLRKLAPKSANTAMLDAQIAYASGQHARAREIYQGLLRVLPENVNLLVAAGENEMKLGALLQAETHLAKATALAPRNPLARRLLADALLRLGQAPKALVMLAPLVDAPDASAEVLALAAQARLLNGEAKAADALYGRLAKLKPTDPKLRTLLVSAGFGKLSDDAVFSELRSIASADTGTSADLAIISAHLKRNQFDGALQALDALDRKRPTDPMVQHVRGQVLSAKNDPAGARQAFEGALKRAPDYFPAVAALAALDLKEGHPDAARQRFNDLLKAQPKNATAMLALSELMAREGAPKAAVLKQIEAATKAVPGDFDARVALISHHFSAGNYDAALGAAQAATAALPDSVDLLELLARCQMRLHQDSQALATYGKIIHLQPKSPRGHVGTADVYLAANQLDQAQRAIARALELSPGLPEAQAQAVVVALRQQQPARALEIARQMQADRPGEATGFLVEGDIEMKRGNWAAALAPLRKALDKPAPGAAPLKLYQAMLRANKGSEAETFAAQWLKTHPRDSAFLFLLGDSAQAGGNTAEAEKRYEAVLAIDPDHVLALNNLAMLRLQARKPGARELAERAVRNAPGLADVLDTLAQVHASEDNLSKAVEVQQRAVALAPNDGAMRLALARYLLQSGDKAQAKAELEKLAQLGSRFGQQAEVSQLLQSLPASLVKR